MDVESDASGSVPEVQMVLTGNSSDVGWKYGKYCDPTNKSKVKCDFCGHISTGGIYRFKKHIVGVENVVSSCKKATCCHWNLEPLLFLANVVLHHYMHASMRMVQNSLLLSVWYIPDHYIITLHYMIYYMP